MMRKYSLFNEITVWNAFYTDLLDPEAIAQGFGYSIDLIKYCISNRFNLKDGLSGELREHGIYLTDWTLIRAITEGTITQEALIKKNKGKEKEVDQKSKKSDQKSKKSDQKSEDENFLKSIFDIWSKTLNADKTRKSFPNIPKTVFRDRILDSVELVTKKRPNDLQHAKEITSDWLEAKKVEQDAFKDVSKFIFQLPLERYLQIMTSPFPYPGYEIQYPGYIGYLYIHWKTKKEIKILREDIHARILDNDGYEPVCIPFLHSFRTKDKKGKDVTIKKTLAHYNRQTAGSPTSIMETGLACEEHNNAIELGTIINQMSRGWRTESAKTHPERVYHFITRSHELNFPKPKTMQERMWEFLPQTLDQRMPPPPIKNLDDWIDKK